MRKLFLQRPDISNQNIDKITGQSFILRNSKESVENFLISHQMSSSKEILFRNHWLKAAMFLFCFEGELSYFKLPSQRPLYFFDHSLHILRGEKLQFTQSNFMQCKLDQKKYDVFHWTWFGRVITNHHCHGSTARTTYFCSQFLRNIGSHWVDSNMYDSL